jgi:hypothetical protein
MSTPALIYLAMKLILLGIALSVHDKQRTGKFSFVSYVISSSVSIGLLYWGGFFAGVPA